MKYSAEEGRDSIFRARIGGNAEKGNGGVSCEKGVGRGLRRGEWGRGLQFKLIRLRFKVVGLFSGKFRWYI